MALTTRTFVAVLALSFSAAVSADCGLEYQACEKICKIKYLNDDAANAGCVSRCVAERGVCLAKAGADKTVEASSEAWDKSVETGSRVWDKSVEASGKAWDKSVEAGEKAWDKTKSFVKGVSE